MSRHSTKSHQEAVTLRLHIDNQWTAAQMGQFFSVCNDIYNFHWSAHFLSSSDSPVLGLFVVNRDVLQNVPQWRLFPAISEYAAAHQKKEYDRLLVAKVAYGSPGTVDLLGLAAAMREIRRLLKDLFHAKDDRVEHKLKMESQRLAIDEQKRALKTQERNDSLDILERQVALFKSLDVPNDVIRKLTFGLDERIESLGTLVNDGHIVFVDNETMEPSDEQ